MSFADLIASRRTATYRLGQEEPSLQRLARILPDVGLDAETVSKIISAYAAAESAEGPTITLKTITKVEMDELRELCKKPSEAVRDASGKVVFGPDGKPQFASQVDSEKLVWVRLAAAIVEPEVPGESILEKADWLAKNLARQQTEDLLERSLALESFDLERVQAHVKN